MYLWGTKCIDTHLLHCRTLQTHIAPSKNPTTDPHPYQTRIYIALTAPSKIYPHALIPIANCIGYTSLLLVML